MGARLVRRICTQIKLEEYVPDASVEFICACIEGLSDDSEWPFSHLSEDKRFLCDIVSNKRSGLDVDKWDYLNRDSVSTLGESSSGGFDVTRLVSAIRVVKGPQRCVGEVAFEEKVALDLNRIFKLRSEMHQMVYQHRVAIVAEATIGEEITLQGPSPMRSRVSLGDRGRVWAENMVDFHTGHDHGRVSSGSRLGVSDHGDGRQWDLSRIYIR